MDSFEKKGKLCCPQSERPWLLAGGGDNVLCYLPYDGNDNEQIYAYVNRYKYLYTEHILSGTKDTKYTYSYFLKSHHELHKYWQRFHNFQNSFYCEWQYQ